MLKADIVVVGGGPAGVATALSIRQHSSHLSVLLVDNSDPSVFRVGECLPAEAIAQLGRLCPDAFNAAEHVASTGNVMVWGSDEPRQREGMLDPYGLAHHLDRSAFHQALLAEWAKRASQSSTLDQFVRGSLQDIESSEQEAWTLTIKVSTVGDGDQLDDKQLVKTVCCKWVVDATGRMASLSRKIGRIPRKLDDLVAVYAVWTIDPSHEDCDTCTAIEATQDGWWYSALLPRRRRIVAYHTTASHPTAQQARTASGFKDLLLATSSLVSGLLLAAAASPTMMPGYPRMTAANSTIMSPAVSVKQRWCCVGDCALAFDPLSSQGMATAIDSGILLGKALASKDSDRSASLKSYAVHLANVFNAYVEGLAFHYGREDRFEDSAFWREQRQSRFELE